MVDRPLEEKTQPSILGYVKKHPTFSLTIGSLYISLTGMLYSMFLFRSFDINFFDYAELDDFFRHFIIFFQ